MKTREIHVARSGGMTFSPVVLLWDVLKRWFLILAVAVAVGAACYIVTDQSYQPAYRADATLVVTSRDTTPGTFSNLQSTSELASVLTGLLNSSVLQEVVLEELGMSDLHCEISAALIPETNLLTLQVTDASPATAYRVICALIDHHETVTRDVVGDIVVEVLKLPQVPTSPANSANTAGRVWLAVLAAVAATCAALAVVSYFRDVVRSRQEAEAKLHCWCLGEIYHERKFKTLREWVTRPKSSLVTTNPGSSFGFVECMRKLRRRVERYMEDGKVLMVTSVAENEGKSTIAVNLALSLSGKHRRVLLIDLDLRKAACHKILNQKQAEAGVWAVLTGGKDLASAVVREPLSGLDVLLGRSDSGITASQITTMLASGSTAALITEARKAYDYVILDLPPMTAGADTEYVLDYADSALLVVRQNMAHARIINRSIAALENGKAKLLGCVLNDVHGIEVLHNTGTYGYGAYEKNNSRKPDKTGK